jgi:hypothetical protein
MRFDRLGFQGASGGSEGARTQDRTAVKVFLRAFRLRTKTQARDCCGKGFVVPYLDIMAMADRVISLLDSSECRKKIRTAARRKVEQRHDISSAGPRIMEIIERTMSP